MGSRECFDKTGACRLTQHTRHKPIHIIMLFKYYYANVEVCKRKFSVCNKKVIFK